MLYGKRLTSMPGAIGANVSSSCNDLRG
jgi:hypothetical protein